MATCKFNVGDKVVGNHPTRYLYTRLGWKGVVTAAFGDYINVRGEGNDEYNTEFCGLEVKYFDLVENEKIVITHDCKTTTATLYREDGSTVKATARCAPEDTFDFNVGAKLAFERLNEKVTPVTVGGFKIGDRVNYKGVNGTIICFSKGNLIGVEFDRVNGGTGHNCKHVALKAGTTGTKNTSRWLTADDLTPGEVPTYWTGRAVCIGNDHLPDFTVGKIYKVDNGKIIDNQSCYRPITPDRISKPDDLTAKTGYFSGWNDKFIPIVE